MKESLLTQFHAIQGVARANLSGLTEDVSYHQSGGNCIHWLVGHLTTAYNGMLPLLGGEPVWDDETAKPYTRYSEPVTDREGRLSWNEMTEAWETAQNRFIEAFEKMDPSRADEKAPFSPRDDDQETLGSLLALIAFHQGYHVGQIGLARRAAGVDGAFK